MMLLLLFFARFPVVVAAKALNVTNATHQATNATHQATDATHQATNAANGAQIASVAFVLLSAIAFTTLAVSMAFSHRMPDAEVVKQPYEGKSKRAVKKAAKRRKVETPSVLLQPYDASMARVSAVEEEEADDPEI